MKLYYSKGACSLVVRILIHEMQLPCEYEAVNLGTKITVNGTDFLTINPKGAVPVLITDDNSVLTENAVIQQYLADTYQAHQLLPPLGDFQRYRVLEWVNFITTEIHKSFSPIFNANIPDAFKEGVITPILQTKFAIVNQALEKNQYLMGKQFTLPDAYLFVMLLWAASKKIDLKKYPNLIRFFSELKQRKAIIEALAEEDINAEKAVL